MFREPGCRRRPRLSDIVGRMSGRSRGAGRSIAFILLRTQRMIDGPKAASSRERAELQADRWQAGHPAFLLTAMISLARGYYRAPMKPVSQALGRNGAMSTAGSATVGCL